MTLDDIVTVVEQDFKAVDALIQSQLNSTSVPFISKVGDYIVSSGGKRIRPLVSLLSARACGYKSGDAHVTLAAVIEFLHTATLLHDDVVDESNLRRGKATVNSLWGNSPSILVGDFLISRAFQMIVSLHDMKVLEILSNATNQIAEGEVLQLLNCHNPDTTESDYYRVIKLKTAKMFEAASECGAVISKKNSELERSMAAYALHIGNAFQLIDDVLDYTGCPKETGKNIGDDLNEGKATLPLIYAIQNGTKSEADFIREILTQNSNSTKVDQEVTHHIIKIIDSCGAIEYVQKKARQESDTAIQYLEILEESPHKRALKELANLAVNRNN